MAGAEDISSAQLTGFVYACRATYSNSEDACYQHREVLLNDAALSNFVAAVKFSFSSKGYRIARRTSRDMYGAGFIAFMDQAPAAACAPAIRCSRCPPRPYW
jgi:hypothetical protein